MTKQEAIEEAKKNLFIWIYQTCVWLRDEYDMFVGAEFSDYYSFLQNKAHLIETLLGSLPFGALRCPFCLKNMVKINHDTVKIDCSNCNYAVTHGKCFDDENSIFNILRNSLKLAQQILSNLYTAKKPSQDDIATIRSLVEKINEQLYFWEYRGILLENGKDWREVVKGKE